MAKSKLDLRADPDLIERIERLAARMSKPGAEVSRSGAARVALLRGLDAIEADESATKTKPTKGGKPPRRA